MPAAVAEYVNTKNYLKAQRQQTGIIATLKSDFDKYKK